MKKLDPDRARRLSAPGTGADDEEDRRRELEAIYREAVHVAPHPPGPSVEASPAVASDDEGAVYCAAPGDILSSPEDPGDRAVVLLRDGDRLFLAPIAAVACTPEPLDLDAPETDQHEALRVQCGRGGWIARTDAARLDLLGSMDDRRLCEARRRLILHVASLAPSDSSGAAPLGVSIARAPMGIAIDAEPGPLGPWVAAQLDADRSLSSLAMRWAGTSVGRDLLAAARHLPDGAAREPALLDAIFDGVGSALARIVSAPGASFDDVWVVLEALEEAAAVVVVGAPELGERFAARVASTVAANPSPLVEGGLTWGVNELLERGQASAALAIRIARALLVEPTPLVCDVLYILTTMRRPLADALTASGLSATLAARAVASRSYLSAAAAAVEQLDAAIESAGDRPLETGSVLASLTPLLAKVHAGAREPAEGMLAMAAIKRPLSHLCRAMAHRPERDAIINGVCDAFLAPLAERGTCTAFLVVEALEAVRDAYPEETAAMMADRLVRVQPEVACGFGVCIVEGIEKELAADPVRRAPRFVVHDHPGGARRCEFEDAEPPSAFGDFGRRSRQAAEAYEDVAGVWTWCQERLRGR